MIGTDYREPPERRQLRRSSARDITRQALDAKRRGRGRAVARPPSTRPSRDAAAVAPCASAFVPPAPAPRAEAREAGAHEDEARGLGNRHRFEAHVVDAKLE